MAGAVPVVELVIIGAFTRLITRVAVTALWPTALLVVTTSTFVPVVKSAAVSGLDLVPYWVVEVIVTFTVVPSAFLTDQVDPDTDCSVPATDAALALAARPAGRPVFPAALGGADGVAPVADCGAAEPDAAEADAGATVVTDCATGLDAELAIARPPKNAATATTTTPGAIHIHGRSRRRVLGGVARRSGFSGFSGFSATEGNSVVGGSSFVIPPGCSLSIKARPTARQDRVKIRPASTMTLAGIRPGPSGQPAVTYCWTSTEMSATPPLLAIAWNAGVSQLSRSNQPLLPVTGDCVAPVSSSQAAVTVTFWTCHSTRNRWLPHPLIVLGKRPPSIPVAGVNPLLNALGPLCQLLVIVQPARLSGNVSESVPSLLG